jgi:hypothetical protein
MMLWREYMDRIRSQMLEDIGIKPMKYVSAARSGDIVKCVNGHPMYRLTGDVVPGTVMASSMFEIIDEAPKPESGKMIEPCHICGLPWTVKRPNGGWVLCNVEKKFEP